MGLRLSLVGVKELEAKLEDLALQLDDFDPLWSAISDIMVEHEAGWFASEGEGSWPQLSAYTVKDKARRGFPPDILIRTGALLESLIDPERAAQVGQGRSSIGTFTKKTFSWGSDEPTAQYHQDGRVTPNFMPARPVIVLTPALLARIGHAQDDFADNAIKEADLG